MSRNQITRAVTLFLFLIFLYLVRGALFPIILAVLLYYVLNPLADLLSNKRPKGAGLNRDLAIVISFVIFSLLLSLIFEFILAPIAKEFSQLAANAPLYIAQLKSLYHAVQSWQAGMQMPKEINYLISALIQNMTNYFSLAAQQSANSLLGMLSRLVYLVITPIITYFLLREDKAMAKGVIALLPHDHRDVTVRIIKEIDGVIRNYVVGQAILCSAVGVMCGLGCFLLGVRFAFLLGITAAIAQLIPNIGPLIATLPALAIASLVSPMLAVYVLGLYLIINALMIAVLGPKVLGGVLNLHPVTVVISIIVFGELMGVWGFFFAAPIVAIIKILYLELRNP
jgi:predicted PurR-regulated permease PerM